MCNVAWKILRGAVVASTEMVTLGGVAAYPAKRMKAERKILPESLRHFILARPSICCELILTAAEFEL